jgi:hypothetical protein
MEPKAEISKEVGDQLFQRHKEVVFVVRALLILPLLLSLIAFLARTRFTYQENPPLSIALKITIVIFGLGAITLRRTKFSNMRLRDIAAVRGISGLLATLSRTTFQVALVGASICVLGLIATIATGNEFETYRAALISFFVLLYSYPTRASWKKAVQQFSPGAEHP